MSAVHADLLSALILVASILAAPTVSAQEIPRPPLSNKAGRPAGPVSDPQDVKDLKRAIARNPSDPEPWTTLAWRYYRDSRFGEAEWLLGKARALRPEDLYIKWLSGLTYYRLGNYTEAHSLLWDLYDKQDRWPATIEKDVAWDILGRLFLEKPDLFLSAVFFSKARDHSPHIWQYHFLYGFTEWYRQRYDDALDGLQEAIKLKPNEPIVVKYYAMARAAYDERWGQGQGRARMAAAIDAARRAIRMLPNDPSGHELLGQILVGVGDRQAGIDSLRTAVALESDSAGARFVLARVLLRSGVSTEAAEAERLLIEAIAISPDFWSGRDLAPHVRELGAILINSGREGAAKALFEWHAKVSGQ